MADPLRVLILGDQIADGASLLRQAGFDTACFSATDEAGYLAGLAQAPDLILSPLSTSQPGSLRALDLLREHNIDLPVLVIAENADDQTIAECLRRGADDVASKDDTARLGAAAGRAWRARASRDAKQQAEHALRQSETLFDRVTRHLAVLSQVGQEVAASLELETVLRQLIDKLVPLLGTEISILLLEEDELVFAGVSGARAERLRGQRIPANIGIAGEVVQTGHPVWMTDGPEQKTPDPGIDDGNGHSSQSFLAVPLKLGDEIIGVMEAINLKPETFSNDDQRLLEAASSWAAIAIGNARRHERTRRRLQESEAIGAISRALSSTLDLDQILQLIVDSVHQIIPKVERAVIHLLDEESQALRPAAVAGLVDVLGRPDFSMRPGEGIAGRVIEEGVVINVRDTHTDPRYLRLGVAIHLRSLLVAPVQSGTRRLGTLSASSAAPRTFSTDDEQLFTTLGVQAALAIENARLFEVERRRAEEAEALQKVTQTLISRLNLSAMLEAVVATIASIANYKGVSVYLLSKDMLVLQVQQGYQAPLQIVRIDQGIRGRVARTGQPVFAPDVTKDPDYVEVIGGVQSLVGVPLIRAEQTLGVLIVESGVERLLDRSDFNWLISIGQQLSVAIENARLVTDLEKALKQEQAARAQMVQTEKLAAMGRLVASVAHELNNPLQAIQNALFLVRQEPALSAQAHDDLRVALTEADRMADLIGRLRETYRPTISEEFRLESVNSLIVEVQRLINTHLRHNNIEFIFNPNPSLPYVPAVRDQLKQVVLNLCLNAVEAMPDGGQLALNASHVRPDGKVLLTIADTGIGIDPANKDNIFDPFFTTKQGGTGLGLAITYDIVQRHNGHIEVDSKIGGGTTFKIWLPADEKPETGPLKLPAGR
ncbi:MAG: GAF domain-containing protein [Chloroflexi bacterium]|nr:GAF domain-containing protein [Chloroflexota bacterium]